MKIDLDIKCLQNGTLRRFISNLWCYEHAHIELGQIASEDLKDSDSKNAKLLLSGKYYSDIDSRYSWISSGLINSLRDNKIIELKEIYKDKYSISHGQYTGYKFYIEVKLLSKQKLKEYISKFSTSVVDEPLGMSKQTRVLKDKLREKLKLFHI